MIVGFRMSGGFGGLFVTEPLGLSLDVATMTEPDRSELLDLVARSGLQSEHGGAVDGAAIRDGVTYTVSIADLDGAVDHSWVETTIPPEVRPLLEWLRRRAVAARMGEP